MKCDNAILTSAMPAQNHLRESRELDVPPAGINIAPYKRSASQSILCIAISLIAFVSGHKASSAVGTPQPEQEQKPDNPLSSDKAGKIKFELTSIGNGKSDDGTWWTIYYLTASDGHTLYMQWFPFSTVGRANKQFKLFLRHTTKIIQRGPEVDEKGKTIGKRVLASFADDEKTKTGYRLFWTWENRFCRLEGEHMDDLLVLAERLKDKPLLEIVEQSKP